MIIKIKVLHEQTHNFPVDENLHVWPMGYSTYTTCHDGYTCYNSSLF